MSWSEFKTVVREKYEQCKEYVEEHPVKTVLGVLSFGLGAAGVYKLCTLPQIEVVEIAQSKLSHGVMETIVSPIEDVSETVTRAYNWHEESHFVQEHLRHLADGRVIPVSSYTKVTGGKA